MPPKRGRKRKNVNRGEEDDGASDASLTPPDPAAWPGWVEMESEPALFNVILKEMGVTGVKIQEVLGLEDEMLAILPRPIHALIFLFRYKDSDQADQEAGTECPPYVWFANQIPDFACASVALLNIVNNIDGLCIGTELRKFRDFTQDLDPMSRGDAIDSFDFVKHIHNSFARTTDVLIADMHMKEKSNKAKKRQAIAKARQTRETKRAGVTPLKEKSANAGGGSTRLSARRQSTSKRSAPIESNESSPLSDPPDSDPDFEFDRQVRTAIENNAPQRRSGRKPKPRQDLTASSLAIAQESDEGFHFIAYMPILGRVWKLDGLDSFPQDMGEVAADGDWINIVQPALQTRMAMYEGADIEFNLMAVVHDPVLSNRAELAQNIKKLQMIEKALDSILEDWRTLPEVDTRCHAINGLSAELNISQSDLDAASHESVAEPLVEPNLDLEQLINLRRQTIGAQAPLRGMIRDALDSSKMDDENARHMRHDYGGFVRSWFGALVEHNVLSPLLEDA